MAKGIDSASTGSDAAIATTIESGDRKSEICRAPYSKDGHDIIKSADAKKEAPKDCLPNIEIADASKKPSTPHPAQPEVKQPDAAKARETPPPPTVNPDKTAADQQKKIQQAHDILERDKNNPADLKKDLPRLLALGADGAAVSAALAVPRDTVEQPAVMNMVAQALALATLPDSAGGMAQAEDAIKNMLSAASNSANAGPGSEAAIGVLRGALAALKTKDRSQERDKEKGRPA